MRLGGSIEHVYPTGMGSAWAWGLDGGGGQQVCTVLACKHYMWAAAKAGWMWSMLAANVGHCHTGVTGSFRTWAADEGGKCGGTCHKLWWQASAGGGSGGNMANREVLR